MSEETRPWFASYDPNVPKNLTYENIPVFEYLDRSAKEYPDRAAIIFKNKTITYAELHAQAEIMAANLRAQGVRSGDRVGVMLPNLPQTIVTYWGILKAGGAVVMTNPLYREKEVLHQFNDADVRHLVLLDMLWPKIEPLYDRTPVKKIYITSIPEALKFPLNWLAKLKLKKEGRAVRIPYDGKKILPWKSLLKGKKRYSHPNIMPHADLALLQYTGGTTGVSKGCMITHANLVANATQIHSLLHTCNMGSEVFLGVLPYFHVYGLGTCLNLPTSLGATTAPMPRFDPMEVLQAFGKIKPTIFPGAPSVYIALMHQKRFEETDFSSLRYCVSGSAAMPMEILNQFRKRTGAEIIEGYGLTEASPVTHLNPLNGERKPGTIGLPFPDTDARIVDMEVGGPPLPPGKLGELIIKAPQVMKGYWGRPDETASTLRNGWLYTGDIATMDEQGYFTIVDRKKDLIISAGYNIYPREVDEVLYEHPAIQEACAVGIPHQTRGEIVKAFIVLKPGQQLTKQEILAYCKEKLAGYKVPKRVEFRDELPKTLVGKVLRRALRDEELSRKKSRKKGE
ncbi:MAG: long-chain-fatty-acid--CoA ligase [Desulfovibrio sp.]|uniref:long-chain-fatty-acid--CoA ligase n=1 Tax=Desulfovibrio sp. 7SRBS1 TaxID=3378064 RepID=UPI003B4143D1